MLSWLAPERCDRKFTLRLQGCFDAQKGQSMALPILRVSQ
jgi:hypothetical protein